MPGKGDSSWLEEASLAGLPCDSSRALSAHSVSAAEGLGPRSSAEIGCSACEWSCRIKATDPVLVPLPLLQHHSFRKQYRVEAPAGRGSLEEAKSVQKSGFPAYTESRSS